MQEEQEPAASSASSSSVSRISSEASHPLPLSRQGRSLEVRLVQFETETEDLARGVFTTVKIARGTLVERAHCILIAKKENDDHVSKSCIEHYTYTAPEGQMLLALGLGSLFNHSAVPNLDYRIDVKNQQIEYFATKEIEANSELFIFYGRSAWWEKPKQRKPETEAEALGMEDNLFS